MGLTLSHYSIRTPDLEASRRFYVDALGLAVGPRPDFPFPGLWLYAGDTSAWENAVVHLIGVDPADAGGLRGYLGERTAAGRADTGALDHVAFFATGLAERRALLARLGLTARERTVPGLGLHQLFVQDPDGVVVELNFPAAEAAASAQ
jgi:catechol 2,3-dioxygenase-like lactoylglutathione lyase family enzyme